MSAGNITYWFYDLMTTKMQARLEVQSPTWGHKLDAVGQFQAKLDLADERIKKHTWEAATRPARSLVIVTIDGAIEWGGILWDTTYASATSTLTIKAGEAWSYFSRRVQARDYTNPPTTGPGSAWWNSNPARADRICAALVADAIATTGSAFSSMAINVIETQADTNTVTEQLPIAQVQTIGNVITQLAGAGLGTGFDFTVTWVWSGAPGSTPKTALNFYYPRAGRTASKNSLVLDFGTAGADGYHWPRAGSSQANKLYGTASGSGTFFCTDDDPNVQGAGWPLLETVASYVGINTQTALIAAVKGDLARMEWPVLTPSVSVPMFGRNFAVGEFAMGDTVQVVIPPDERFSKGLTTYMRVTQVEYTPGDQGLPLMKVSLATPPALAPVPPPPGM